MIKSIGLLVVGILIVDVAVITVSFMQQSTKLNEAGANVSVLESQVTALNGELVTLRGSVTFLQSQLADSESKVSNLQAALLASKANASHLSATLLASQANTTIIQEQLNNKPLIPDPTPALTPGIGPPAFTVSNLIITPNTTWPGGSVNVIVTVMNTGGEAGTYTLSLKISETSKKIQDIIKTQDVTLAAGASQNVSQMLPFFEEGEYVLTIDNLSGVVEVVFDG